MHCEGPISIGDKHKRWLCQGAHTTLRVDMYRRLLSLKPWCIEGSIIRGAYVDPAGAGCFRSSAEAEAYAKSLQAQASQTLTGVRRRRRRR